MKHFKYFLYSLLSSVYIRILVGYIRWFYYYKILSRLKTKNRIYYEMGCPQTTVFDKFPLDDFVREELHT